LPFWNRSRPGTWLVVGLGNPGEKYKNHRHNIGFMCLDELARGYKITLTHSRFHARTGEGKVAGTDIILVRPQTFMNLSGEAVGKLVRRHRVKPENLVVAHDEMDLPPGKIRLRSGGSSGHKGINSIIEHTGTGEFIRVRVGVGRPDAGEQGKTGREDIIDHVLGDFTAEEQAIVDKVIPLVAEAIETIIRDGLTAAMNKYNGIDLRKANPEK